MNTVQPLPPPTLAQPIDVYGSIVGASFAAPLGYWVHLTRDADGTVTVTDTYRQNVIAAYRHDQIATVQAQMAMVNVKKRPIWTYIVAVLLFPIGLLALFATVDVPTQKGTYTIRLANGHWLQIGGAVTA